MADVEGHARKDKLNAKNDIFSGRLSYGGFPGFSGCSNSDSVSSNNQVVYAVTANISFKFGANAVSFWSYGGPYVNKGVSAASMTATVRISQ